MISCCRTKKWRTFIVSMIMAALLYSLLVLQGNEDGKKSSKTSSSGIRLPKEDSSDFQMTQKYRQFSNVPHQLLSETRPKNNNSCSQVPKLMNIKFNNIYWQVFSMKSKLDLFLYSAYYDNRPIIKKNPVIRVLAHKSGKLSKPTIFCKIWFDDGAQFAISKLSDIAKLRNNTGQKTTYHPYLLSCPIPHNVSDLVPTAVSLVESPCDMGSNLLRVVHNVPSGEKKDFAVCIKGLAFPYYDMSKFLTEWIELLHILGVDKIFMYQYNVHSNISKVLQYYRALGKVEVIPLTLPGFQPNLHGLVQSYIDQSHFINVNQEILPYNDCFYMNMYQYKYIAILDTDEIIIPQKHRTWKELFNYINSTKMKNKDNNTTHYGFKTHISLNSMKKKSKLEPGIPKYMSMMQNLYRSKKYDQLVKSIFDTSRIIIVYNHYPSRCVGGCKQFTVPTNIAHGWHYRSSCKKHHLYACRKKDVVRDTQIFRYKDELIARTSKTLKTLNLI